MPKGAGAGENISGRSAEDGKTSGIGTTTWLRQEFPADGKNSRADRHSTCTCRYLQVLFTGVYTRSEFIFQYASLNALGLLFTTKNLS
jgi:hypothetical protein